MAISERYIDELMSRCDIVDVVSDYVALTKRSGSNLFGLCPFHSEKTPSFSVSADKQIYHCFGCGKGGGVINFIMEMENLGFADAVAYLAKKAGMPPPEDDTPEEVRSKRARLLDLNRDAARFFYKTLLSAKGKTAVEYINRRGISKEMVRRFGLGAAPDEWNALSDAMIKKGYRIGELLDAGLAKKGKNGGVYDVFRNRLMFPVIDVRGNVIGFSGRILDDGEPKYLNSPDTAVFSKSRNLFALNLAKTSKRGMLILAEGNIDVVSLHQAGFDCAVASLGTSLAPEQARLMSRYSKNAVIAYDSDAAGVKAAERAISLLEKTGMAVRVLRMAGAKDPDEFIKKNGPEAFGVLLDRSENHIEYILLAVKAKHNLDTDEGRISYLKEATDKLAGINSAVEREIYSRSVAQNAGVSSEAVMTEVKKAFRRKMSTEKRREAKENARPSNIVQPKEKTLRYENVASAMAEEGIIRLLMLDESLTGKAETLEAEDFTSECLGKVFSVIKKRWEEQSAVNVAALSQSLSQEEMSHITAVLQKPETLAGAEDKLLEYINRIKKEKQRRLMKEDPLAAMRELIEKKGSEDKR